MKKAKSELNDWGRPEYKRSDFGLLVRGKYAKLLKAERETVGLQCDRMKPEVVDAAKSGAKPDGHEARRERKKK